MDSLNELEWLLEVSPQSQPDGDGMASMEHLVATSIDHLACVSGALVLRNGLHVRVRSRSAESLGGNLLSLRRLEEALIDGIGSGNAADLERHLPCAPAEMTCKAITVPVTGRSSEPLGALFFIRGPESPHFDRGHLSLAQLLSRQVANVLQAQLDPVTGLYTRATLHTAVRRWATPSDRETGHAETPQLIARSRETGVDYAQGDGVEKARPLPDVLQSLEAEAFARDIRRSGA